MRKYLIVPALLLVSGCATGIDPAKYNNAPSSPEAFSQCHGYSCTYKTRTGFSKAEWKKLENIFKKKQAATPEQERSKIALAVAMMEKMIGDKTGTSEDVAEAVSLKTSGLQMDCIDETVNTSRYLGFLQAAGWLKFHQTAEPTHRGYIIDGRWPHNTAEIKEIRSGRLYVVDAFYRDNGQEPYILPRETWLSGWSPHRKP